MNLKIQRNFKSALMKGFMVLIFGIVGEVIWGQNIQGGTAPTLTATPTNATFGSYANSSPWFMAWDDTYLYVGKTGGASAEAVIIYLDLDPTSPSNGGVSGGGNSAGSQTGTSDWSCTPTLPFNADIRIYATNNYLEYSSRNGSGGWNTAVNITTGNIGNDGTTNRTLRFQWTLGSIVANRPAAFNWTGYHISNSTFIYHQIPSQNASGTQNTPRLYFYQSVANTSSTSTTNPFSSNQLSFETRVSFGYNNTFTGTIYDYTVNGGTTTLSRSLDVRNNLVVNNGDFRSSGAQNLTMSGAGGTGTIQINNINGGSITGTDAGFGNDIALIISGGTITLNGNATSNFDHEKKFISASVSSGATLALSRGLSIRYGTFNVAGTIQINSNGYIQSGVASNVAASYNSSTGSLIYNNGGIYTATAFEWPSSNGPRYITIQNSGTNLTLNSSRTISSTGSMTVNAGCSFSISSGILTTNNNLTLKSDGTGTASIGNSAGTISGNVTVERFVSSVGRRWRFLSSPVTSATVANWMSQFYVTGPGDGSTTSTPNTLGAPMSSGWHASKANIDFPNSTFGSDPRSVKTTSIRTYNESASGNNTNLNAGWTNLTGTSQALTPGQGFRTFVRGPIGTTGQLDGSVASQASVTLALSGTVNQGDVTPTLTNNTQGWNFLGNPYACGYDFNAQFDAGQGITNIDPTVYVYDAVTNGYVSYNASSNTLSGLASGVIPSGAGFFVRATGAPTFQFREAYKTTAVNPTGVHKTDVSTVDFGIKYFKDSTESDYMVVKMFEGATMNSELFDIKKVYNENLNLSAYGEDTIQLTASCIPFITGETKIKLNVEASQVGTYHFDFKNMDNFQSNITVSLFDRFTNTTTDVRKNTKYTFVMDAGVNQWGKNRFELILNLDKTVVDEFALLNQTQMSVYPNPATDVLNINISNSSFKNSEVVVYNISGMEVLKTNMAANNAQLNIETLSNGVYFVKVTNQNGFNKTVKFVK